ncbi:MAG: branched-chain amino acid ABC transporter permease [Clostridia bacterium]|nr:branched-chain amino acid ABC transporter permease [Clostridia bacterium]
MDKTMRGYRQIPIWLKYLINAVLLCTLLVLGNHIVTSGAVNRAQKAVILQIGIYILLAVSLNVATGYLGQLPLGHAGFMAVGAYAAALLWKTLPKTTWAVILGLLLGGLVAAAFGVIIGVPALRLKGDYLAIITLGFGEIIRVLIINLPGITGGTPGLMSIPKHSTFLTVYITVILSCALIHTLMKSRHGRAILAIRENEIAAEASGVNTTFYKVLAFTVSAFFAGVAGGLYAGYTGILTPGNFTFMTSINILVMVVLGGLGSMAGSIIAAAILTYLPLALQSFSKYRMVIYAVLLIVTMIFKPSGLLGRYDFSLSRILEKLINGRLFTRKAGKAGEDHA